MKWRCLKWAVPLSLLLWALILWPVLAQTRDVTLTPDQLPDLTITLPGAGEFQIPVVATGPGGTVTSTMTITVVQAAPPPTLTVQDVEGAPGEPIPLDITATDADTITVTIPEGATLSTEIIALGNLQEMIDAVAEGGTVVLPPGLYLGQSIRPKANQTIQAAGVIMDGQGTAVRAIPRDFVDGVTLVGLTVTKYNSPTQGNGGAIDGRDHMNWIYQDVNVVANLGLGLYLGPGDRISGGLYADNGTVAIAGANSGSVIIEDIECRNNNTTHQGLGFESGCMKVYKSQATIRNICSWGNWGPGIWLDGAGPDAGNHVIEDNVVFDNKKSGIEIELQAGGVVRRNTVVRNGIDNGWGGGAGIKLQNSGGFLVHDNYVEVGINEYGDIGNSIFTVNQDRAIMARDNDIFNNEIVFLADGKGTQGTVQDFDSGFDPFAVNTWHDNTVVRSSETPVRWGGWYAWSKADETGGAWRLWEGVQSVKNGEANSTLALEQRQPTQVQCP